MGMPRCISRVSAIRCGAAAVGSLWCKPQVTSQTEIQNPESGDVKSQWHAFVVKDSCRELLSLSSKKNVILPRICRRMLPGRSKGRTVRFRPKGPILCQPGATPQVREHKNIIESQRGGTNSKLPLGPPRWGFLCLFSNIPGAVPQAVIEPARWA